MQGGEEFPTAGGARAIEERHGYAGA